MSPGCAIRPSGVCASTVTDPANPGTAAISAWKVGWNYTGGQAVTQGWNATVTQTGTAVSAANVAWNGTVPAGGSTSFGLLAIIPLEQFRQMAIFMAVGVILDTVIVRSLLVPSLVALTGRAGMWPGRQRATETARSAAELSDVGH